MRFKRLEIVLNILFWGLMTWIFVFGNNSMDIQSTEIIDGKNHKTLVRNYGKVCVLLIAQVLFIIFFYIELYLIYKLKKPRAIRGFVLKSIGIFLFTFIFYIVIVYFFVSSQRDLKGLSIFSTLLFYTAVVICYGFIKKWIQHERDRQQLELIKNQAELDLLKQQLQPHFLFNTMNNLLAMVNQTDNPKLAEGIDKLSGLLRYVVYDTKNVKVSISDEISFIKNFAELHLLRFEDDEIDFNIKTTGTFDTQQIEPGIFLCYVENAFKHGVQPEENAFVYIDIDISKNDAIVFLIENSIPKTPFEKDAGGFGLQSNQNRLNLTYPDKHAIELEEKSDTYKVKLTINTND